MAEMKVGDIGVIQNASFYFGANGSIAEITAISKRLDAVFEVKIFGLPSSHYTGLWSIQRNQIRPLSDPDAEGQETRELVAG